MNEHTIDSVYAWAFDNMEGEMNGLSERICDCFRASDCYILDVKRRTGRSESTIRDWLDGNTVPSSRAMLKTCEAMGWDFDYIVASPPNPTARPEGATFGERLTSLMKDNGDTYKTMGERVGCSYPLLAQYRNGGILPSVAVLGRICREYSVSALYMMTGKEMR